MKKGHNPIRLLIACFGLLALNEPLNGQREFNDSLTLPTEFSQGSYTTETLFEMGSILCIDSPIGSSNQLYIGERVGRIQLVSDFENLTIESTPFLDISSRVRTNSENGLLGLAFHPNYQQNGYFYVFYTTNASGRNTNRLSRFTRSDSSPSLADPESEVILFDQFDEADNHNGGDLHFGPDGYLYISVGDEGGGNDNYQNGQFIDKDLFAGLLRLDVDRRSGNLEPTAHDAIPLGNDGKAAFSIPADNPLVDGWQANGSDPESDLRLEFFAIGLRNPWRFTIDPVTGDIWVADVGQNAYEEINLVVKGGNYGWPNREAFHEGPGNRDVPPEFGELLDPVFEYGRSLGVSVTGGIVYRGSALPELYGAYLFSDYVSGRVWALRKSASEPPWTATEIASISNAAVFAADPNEKELLVGRTWGTLEKLVRTQESPEPDFPQTLSETGAFSNLSTLEAETGLYSYDVNLPFWSDHAVKRRWVSIPEGQSVGYQEDENWQFPEGSIWVKHFELEMERGNPESARRVETRFLVKTSSGAYGISYQWNDEQTEATLVPETGTEIDYTITDGSETIVQTWNIPSRQQCLSCHTEAEGYALSFNTRQLNRDSIHDGQTENTLEYFSRIGVLDTDIDTPSSLPKFHPPDDESATLYTRARSYLAVNCVSCHQPNGGAPLTWDARPSLDLEATGLVNGQASNNGGSSENLLFVPGEPQNSVLLHRISASQGFTRMPPIATNVLDQAGIDLIRSWIANHDSEKRFLDWQETHFTDASLEAAAHDADPDQDGNSNRLEYLNDTLPLDAQSRWEPAFNFDSDSITVSFPTTPGRYFVIEKSTDLSTWTDWEVPGNPPDTNQAEATIEGSLSAEEPAEFFRVKVEE